MQSHCIYTLYPEISTLSQNYLAVGDRHEIYYETCGNPNGVPIVFLHGGPGSGCNPTQRRFFDPKDYYIVLIDQRGCGRSQPLGETTQNTTDDLVEDIEAIRQKLQIKKWLVFGGSWGSTLGLCYALAYPQQVAGLILRGIFLSRPSELHWFLGGVQQFHPEPWRQLCDYLPENQRDNLLLAYQALIFSNDTQISIPAAIRWNAYENSMMTLLPKTTHNEVAIQGDLELARARVQIHYIINDCFISKRDLLAEAKQKLGHIPTHIIQGRYDMVCPPITAWELSQAMPHAKLEMIADAGHSAMEASTTAALLKATENFKRRNANHSSI